MPLQVTPVNRNLQTRVTFMLLEIGGSLYRAGRGGDHERPRPFRGW